MTDTVPGDLVKELVTYANAPSGVIAIALGPAPTGMVVSGALVSTRIAVTVLEPRLVTYANAPSGLTATPTGPDPTSIVEVTVLVAVSITETLSERKLAT